MIFLYILLGTLGYFWITWVFYLAVMNLDRNKDKMSKVGKFFGYFTLIVGYPLDIILNVVFGTIMFLELPKDPLFTARLSRWNDDLGWRGTWARWLCKHLLDDFDPDGHHCS